MFAICTATHADAGEMLTVLRAAFVTEAQLHDDVHMAPLTETLDEVREVIASGTVLVAVQGTRLVGTARAALHGAVWHIGRVVVAPDLQGRGIGSALIHAIEAAAPDGVERFEIATGPKSTRNVTLYERHQYRTVPSEDILIHLTKKRESR